MSRVSEGKLLRRIVRRQAAQHGSECRVVSGPLDQAKRLGKAAR